MEKERERELELLREIADLMATAGAEESIAIRLSELIPQYLEASRAYTRRQCRRQPAPNETLVLSNS